MIFTIALLGLMAATYEPTGPNHVENGSLEAWTAGAPTGWTLETGTGGTWQAATARQSASHQDGLISMKLRAPASPEDVTRLRQALTFDLASLPTAGRLQVSAYVQCARPGGVVLSFEYRTGDGAHTVSAPARGTGAWEQVTLTLLLPPEATPLSVTVQRAAEQPGDVLIDDVRVQGMTEAAPAAPDDGADVPRPTRNPHGGHP